MTEKKEITGLALLREPFPANQISKLPKGSKKQNDCPASEKVTCKVCGGWHHPKIIHLDYVGHAALTDRLLDIDPDWDWEPMAVYENGLPAFDEIGGLWIRLQILGKKRIGYGSADGKSGGNAKKEVIGDAMRNAAMRFGAALDLWHKGDLHVDEPEEEPKKKEKLKGPLQRTALDQKLRLYRKDALASTSMEEFEDAGKTYKAEIDQAAEQWPEYFTDVVEDQKSLKHQIRDKVAELKREEEIFKQQREETEFKNDF